MKKQKFFAATAATAVMVSTAAVPASAAFFTDVKQDNALYPEILDLYKQGKINGFKDGTFRPQESVTRGQAAKMVADILELNTTSPKVLSLKDVPKEKWYYGAIAALVEKNIMSGFKDGTFRPDQTLTRAEASRLISEAFKLIQGESTVTFTDVAKEKWYYTYIQSLVHNKVTFGKTAKTFAPDDKVTRGELVAFAARAKKASSTIQTVESITGNQIEISGKTYTASSSVQALFQSSNSKALKNAQIQFTEKNGVIQSVTSLTLKAAGTEEAPVVFDGGNAVIIGNVIIDADYNELKNVTINGNLTITQLVKESFATNKVTVNGTTSIEETNIVKAAATEEPKTRIKITFKDSSVAVIEISKQDVYFSATGSTKVTAISLFANTDIFADADVIIPRVDIYRGVTQIVLNATIQDVVIDSNDDIQLSGKGNFNNVTVNTDKKVTFNTTGSIQNLDVKNEKAILNLGENTSVTNVTVPAGKDAAQTIENFDSVKEKIENVGGTKNPDYTAPISAPVVTTPPSSGGETVRPAPTSPVTDGGGTVTPTPTSPVNNGDYFAAGILEVENQYGYVTLNIKNAGSSKVMYEQVRQYLSDDELPKEGDLVPSTAVEYQGESFIKWISYDVVAYRVDSNNRILDVARTQLHPYSLLTTEFEDNEDISFQVLLPKEEKDVDEYINYLYIYQDGIVKKFMDLSTVSWKQGDIPAFTLTAPELDKEKPTFILFSATNYATQYGLNNGYDDEVIKIQMLKDLAKDTNSALWGHEFSNAIGSLAYKEVEETSSDGSTYILHESLAEQDSLSMKTYKQRVTDQSHTLETAEAIKQMIQAVNEELKDKVESYKAARAKVDALYKEDRYDYDYDDMNRLREGITAEQIQEAKQAVEALSTEFTEKTQLTREINQAEYLFEKESITQYMNSLQLSVPANAEMDTDLMAQLFAEGKPENLRVEVNSVSYAIKQEANTTRTSLGSRYLQVMDNKVSLKRLNQTGENKTEYLSVQFYFEDKYVDEKVIPVTIESPGLDPAALSTETNIQRNKLENFVNEVDNHDKKVHVYRGVTVEQLKKGLRADDYSAQSYTILDASGAERSSGQLEKGNTVVVKAENGETSAVYSIDTVINIIDVKQGEMGHVTFKAEHTTAAELQQSLKGNFGDITVVKLEEANTYQATFTAEKNTHYHLISWGEVRVVQDSSSLIWRNFALYKETDSYPQHAILLKDEDAADDFTIALNDIQFSYTLNQSNPDEKLNTLTVDGVTIKPVIAQRADGSFKIAFESEGEDAGQVNVFTSVSVDVTVNDVATNQLYLDIQSDGTYHLNVY